MDKAYNGSLAFAHVGSVATARMLSSYSDIEMFLAPLAVSSKEYASHCLDRSQAVFTILDSGALELSIGTSNVDLTDRDYLSLSIDLGIDEVVATDCPNDPSKSLLRTKDFLVKWKQLKLEKKPRVMVVPHGKNNREWFDNAEALILEVGTCTVGIPRLFFEKCGNGTPNFRIQLASIIKNKYPFVDIHLLGASEDFLSELEVLGQGPHVRSVDSTFMHRYAYTGADPFQTYVEPLQLNDPVVPTGYTGRLSILDKEIMAAFRRREYS